MTVCCDKTQSCCKTIWFGKTELCSVVRSGIVVGPGVTSGPSCLAEWAVPICRTK